VTHVVTHPVDVTASINPNCSSVTDSEDHMTSVIAGRMRTIRFRVRSGVSRLLVVIIIIIGGGY